MNTKRLFPLLFAATLASSSAESIHYNFYNSAGTPAAEDPAVLIGPAGGLGETWNQGNGTSGTNLLNSTGAATTVGFTIPSSNRWNWGNPDLKMAKGGSAQFGKGDNSTFTLTGLTPGENYDIYLASYAHSTTVAERAVGAWTTANPTSTIGPQGIDCRAKLNGTTWEAGINYVRFANVEANASGNIVFTGDAWNLTASTGDEWRLPLNGFQITPAAPVVPPEPLEITEIVRNSSTDEITLTWKSNPGETYGLYWSANLADFTMHGAHHAVPADASAKRSSLGPIPSPQPGAEKLFFRIGPPDVSEPALSQVFGSGNTVTLVFSEPIHSASAAALGNFNVTLSGAPVAVLTAALDASGKKLLLTLAGSLQTGTDYAVTARNITTLAGRVIPALFNGSFQTWDDDPEGVQVFILAGQSNMVGHGKTEIGHGDVPGAIGSLRHEAVKFPTTYGHLLVDPANPSTSAWKTRSDVKVWWRDSDLTESRGVIKGDLKIGYSQSRNPEWIGPEFGFGWAVADAIEKPVLIIKTAWGGKSLHVDFRPPSAVAARGGVIGPYYTGMIDYVRDCLTHLGTEFPEFNGMGYRIAGIGWHQGWNDRVDPTASSFYEVNLVDLITDLRAEFGKPELPISITTTGMDPPATYTAVELAQLAMIDAVKYPAFVGNVFTTDARPFWRVAAESPSNFGYHWNHNGESQYLNGKAMGEKMVGMLAP